MLRTTIFLLLSACSRPVNIRRIGPFRFKLRIPSDPDFNDTDGIPGRSFYPLPLCFSQRLMQSWKLRLPNGKGYAPDNGFSVAFCLLPTCQHLQGWTISFQITDSIRFRLVMIRMESRGDIVYPLPLHFVSNYGFHPIPTVMIRMESRGSAKRVGLSYA